MASRFKKPSVQVRVADGAGGMRTVPALGFDDGEWPIHHMVPASGAIDWMAHWHAVAEARNWSGSSLAQLEAEQNSGTLIVHLTPGADAPAIECAWERVRNGDLHVRLRPGGRQPPTTALVAEFLDAIETRLRNHVCERAYRRSWLTYSFGLPWTGEVWLTETLRLGPPSRFPDALLGQQIVIVDTIVEGIGSRGIRSAIDSQLRSLCLVLSPLLGITLCNRMQLDDDWVPEIDEHGRFTDCRLRSTGYVELDQLPGMPPRDEVAALPLVSVKRPGLERGGIWQDDRCIKVPDDVPTLWQRFVALLPAAMEQFLSACNAYTIARSMFPDQRTAYVTFLVVACEALKPSGRHWNDANIYDVVASLVDADTALRLRNMRVPAQRVRSKHVHRGELVARELVGNMADDPFADPSFDEMLGDLARVTRICLIEWLRQGGAGLVSRASRLPRSVSRPIASTAKRRNA